MGFDLYRIHRKGGVDTERPKRKRKYRVKRKRKGISGARLEFFAFWVVLDGLKVRKEVEMAGSGPGGQVRARAGA